MLTLQLLQCMIACVIGSPTRLHYAVEVITANTLGQTMRRRVIDGDVDYGRQEETWRNVGLTDDSGRKIQPFMEGLRYDSSIKGVLSTPNEARKLPELATEARDMVDDMVMFREFAAYSTRLKPGEEMVFGNDEKNAKGLNANTILSKLGTSILDGHRCLVIKYENFFTKTDLNFPGVHLQGRSHTWGEIWVDQQTHTLVRAAMREDLLGELTMGDAKASTPIDVFRKGSLKLR